MSTFKNSKGLFHIKKHYVFHFYTYPGNVPIESPNNLIYPRPNAYISQQHSSQTYSFKIWKK